MRAEPWIEAASGCRLQAAPAGGFGAALGSGGMGSTRGVPAQARIIYALAVLAGVWFILPRAWFALRTLRPDMNLLMTLATCGAMVIGEPSTIPCSTPPGE